ncbi:hypothetical protein [Clostridium beijerinckii]|uniref:hypothetical protein n=1 Tax=Clostridium beijerinckii TaxID=1520 RepID=UPI00156F8038|nr:hypothetical protein [Clostridium beijerinckii]NRU52389.1 hypothetical protein [Clostridium beijerinckii]NRU52689.1 hypothetical protein [Clostridium beijerinckii]NYC68731.1 hypothetical protein [Clostridium beijerinckii]NYC91880.1 hypothetical protein [Clostridium beijerinckii]
MVVSEPVKIELEIEDKQTCCTYIYKGENINDCIKYFQSMFFGEREYGYRILWYDDSILQV